jgi:hypothetical protein
LSAVAVEFRALFVDHPRLRLCHEVLVRELAFEPVDLFAQPR